VTSSLATAVNGDGQPHPARRWRRNKPGSWPASARSSMRRQWSARRATDGRPGSGRGVRDRPRWRLPEGRGGGTRTAASGGTMSSTPSTAVATTGRPRDSASSRESGSPSHVEVETTQSASCSREATSSTAPMNRTRSPAAAAASSNASRMGPSPATSASAPSTQRIASTKVIQDFWGARRPMPATNGRSPTPSRALKASTWLTAGGRRPAPLTMTSILLAGNPAACKERATAGAQATTRPPAMRSSRAAEM
jgi:hypothetical protein